MCGIILKEPNVLVCVILILIFFLQEKVCLRYEIQGTRNNFLHEAEMANLLHHKDILAFYGVIIASSYSPSVALVSYKLFAEC